MPVVIAQGTANIYPNYFDYFFPFFHLSKVCKVIEKKTYSKKTYSKKF